MKSPARGGRHEDVIRDAHLRRHAIKKLRYDLRIVPSDVLDYGIAVKFASRLVETAR